MTTTLATVLSNPQWRLVNLLYREGMSPQRRRVSTALAIADASPDDLLELVEAGLVTVDIHRINEQQRDVDVRELLSGPHKSTVRDDPGLFARLTQAGLKWATTAAANVALHAIADHSHWGRGALASALQHDLGFDVADLVAAFAERGLVTVTAAGVPVAAAAVYRWLRTSNAMQKAALKLTDRGRRIIRP